MTEERGAPAIVPQEVTTPPVVTCPFCGAQPGQAITATEAQATAHREHNEERSRRD